MQMAESGVHSTGAFVAAPSLSRVTENTYVSQVFPAVSAVSVLQEDGLPLRSTVGDRRRRQPEQYLLGGLATHRRVRFQSSTATGPA